jgi:hypothetical protein
MYIYLFDSLIWMQCVISDIGYGIGLILMIVFTIIVLLVLSLVTIDLLDWMLGIVIQSRI